MRYQERIYIQNNNSSVRNKDILNVNMSSDLCIFASPLFNLSGASKLDCECHCPSGYTLTDTTCKSGETTTATFSGTAYNVLAASPNGAYGTFGTRFFENIDNLTFPLNYSAGTSTLKDNDGNGIAVSSQVTITTPSNTLWMNVFPGPNYDGRLNDCGIWPTLIGTPIGEWIGFSYCLDIPQNDVYSLGIAGDNHVRIKINGEIVVNLTTSPADNSTNFKFWHVFPITLTAGLNIIELEGLNTGLAASFGAEIYDATPQVLSGMTTTAELSAVTLFTTKDRIGNVFDLGQTNGYSCPTGYSLNTCETPFTCTKIIETGCTTNTGTSYVISTATTIPVTFQFTGNTDSFSAANGTFKYEVYKYNPSLNAFIIPPVYKSDLILYSGFSGSNSTTQALPVSGLSLDGDYLVKGYYEFDACTDFMSRLGKKVDTLTYRSGTEFGLYNPSLDYYFAAMTASEVPTLLQNQSNTPPANQLFQQVILPPSGETVVVITNFYSGDFVLTLNGLVLAPNLDYVFTGNVVTLSSATVSNDVITAIYTTSGGNNLMGDNIHVTSPVVSGVTNGEGSNTSYFNTTTGKYEIYTSLTPAQNGSILVMINGATLANGADYYQSISNPKRIILEGDIQVGDVISIVYFPSTNVVNGIITNNPSVSWYITTPPQLVNGLFTLEVSTGSSFTTLLSSGTTDYIVGTTLYYNSFVVTGTIGQKLYYRVKNEKNYVTICGDLVNSIAYSETIPLTIQSNSINSY